MSTQKIELLLLSARRVAELLGISKGHFYNLYNSGRLGPLPIRFGRRTLWSRKELEAWIADECPARRQWQELKKIKPKAKSA